MAIACTLLAACGPAASNDTADGALDTTRLPRVTGAKQIYASPLSTVYTTPTRATEAADTIARELSTGGWQRYVAPFTDYAKSDDFRIMSFKKGPHALQVSVMLAPAQGNATSVSYTALVLTNDLPVPVDATDIAFDPARPYLACATAMPLTDAREYFTRELAAMGFALWPGLAQQEANKTAAAEPQKAAHAYYVRDNSQPLRLVLRRGDDDRTKIEIEAVSAEMLTAELAPDPTPAAPETRYRAKKTADPMDAMIENAMQQMTEAVLAAAGEAVANAGKPTAKPHTSGMEEAQEATAAAQAAAEPVLVAEDMDGFPIPESHTSTHSGQTKFRTERDTTVPAPLGSVLAFYRRELPKSGWKEADAVVAADRAVLSLVSEKGRGVLTLSRQDGETAVSFVERREAEAKKAGILPKAGQAKLIFGSMAEAPAKVIFGKRTITIPPGMGGSERPDGPMLDLPPGKYAYSVVVAGAAPTKEEVEVADGESWALVIGPAGGSMPLHMY